MPNITVSDGVSIAIHDTGGSGRPLVLANGLGGSFASWRHQVDYLSDRYRIISWDYRGLYGSTPPTGDPPRLGVAAHVDDLERVLELLGVTRAAFLGWSMGVQVILELYERRPELVSHLILLNGTFGRPLHSTSVPLSSRIVPGLVDQTRRMHEIASSVLRRATQWPETVMWLKRLGVVGNTMDEDLFREIAAEFGGVNLELYLTILRELGEHDAAHVLDNVAVPTLVITGDRDAFTPRQLAQQMARRIRGGEILVVRGATHYAALEYPELVNLRIEKFLREHGY
ncbi:MAG: alpha/beta hydrolase [Polyangiaceae bacterium]|nr:alpha/beta hydrolase [Polyangiaceae bacterium]